MITKPGLEEEYAKYVEINNGDEYSKACVDAGEAVGIALDEGMTGKDALEVLTGHDLTGFMATMAVKAVAHFHPRGEEVRVAWNKDWGNEELEKGLINPAVLNVDEKSEKMSPEIESV